MYHPYLKHIILKWGQINIGRNRRNKSVTYRLEVRVTHCRKWSINRREIDSLSIPWVGDDWETYRLVVLLAAGWKRTTLSHKSLCYMPTTWLLEFPSQVKDSGFALSTQFVPDKVGHFPLRESLIECFTLPTFLQRKFPLPIQIWVITLPVVCTCYCVMLI